MPGTMFFYGSLCHMPLLERVLGASRGDISVVPATLKDHAAYWVAGQSYPMIVAESGAVARGVLVRGLGAEARARLNFYEGGHSYELRPVEVETAQGKVATEVYFPLETAAMVAGAPWDLAEWQARIGPVAVEAAGEVMRGLGQRPAMQALDRYPAILARAAARLNAKASAPTTHRRRAGPGDVHVIAMSQPYARFFAVEDYTLTHRRFDGRQSAPLERAAFVSTDAVTVLPYDPVRDRVLLIEQFRVGPFARGDAQCWSLEAIAGRIEPGEPVEETARREAVEEAGLKIGALERVASYYPSPGAKTEYLYSFVALCDLPDGAAGPGGLAAEGEDIRGHLVGFEHLMRLLDSGELENAPLIVSVLWLARHRERLRSGA